MDKKSLSERDICTKFITPALRKAGWDEMAQIREEVSFTKGRIIVRGKLVSPARLSSRRKDKQNYGAISACYGNHSKGPKVSVNTMDARR